MTKEKKIEQVTDLLSQINKATGIINSISPRASPAMKLLEVDDPSTAVASKIKTALIENEEDDPADEEVEEDPVIQKNGKAVGRYIYNDETEDAMMLDMMKKSTEMFGARKSVSQMFMMRRSTSKTNKPKNAWESKEEAKDQRPVSMLAAANKQNEQLEVLDIADDMKDILCKKEESHESLNPFGEAGQSSPEESKQPELNN
jgi:myo-inositol-hexaphosphate 3-phosphohydrolase